MTLDNASDVRNSLIFLESPRNCIAYELISNFTENYCNLIIVHNANKEEIKFVLPDADEWKILSNEFEVNKMGVCKGTKTCINEISIPSLSTCILCKH